MITRPVRTVINTAVAEAMITIATLKNMVMR